MSLNKENVIFVYRSGDSDSLAVANKYKSIHSLETHQLVPVPCSTNEILDNEATFNSEVLDPIKSAISSGSLLNHTIWAIVLGFNVPGGFKDGNDIIAATSRVSRLNHSFSKKVRNYLYDRASFKHFDATDSEFALISSRIDAPTKEICEDLLDKTEEFQKVPSATGKFYVDPYSGILGADAVAYQDDILDFLQKEFANTQLELFSTIFLDPYIDVVLPFVEDDSFTWSWFADRGSLSFFRNSNAARIFFYNADYDGSLTVRDASDRRWPALAMRSDYMATAGAMSSPGFDGFLSPRPFFKTLIEKATIGEAALFSTRFLDWTINIFGDPLTRVLFALDTASSV